MVRWAVIIVLLTSVNAVAQVIPGRPLTLMPSKGELVEFKRLGRWREGFIVEVGKDRAMIDYVDGATTRQDVFRFADIRYPWQSKVITPAYRWKDSTGDFSIEAAVRSIDDRARTVTLVRVDDGSEVTLEFDKLGEMEQRRIKIIMQLVGEPPHRLPPLTTFAPASTSAENDWSDEADLSTLAPDPPKIKIAIPEGGAAFGRTDIFESLVGVYPIGTDSGWMLGATNTKSRSTAAGGVSRLIWATIADGKIHRQHRLEAGQQAIAVDAASSSVLTIGPTDDRKTALTVYRANPKLRIAKPLLRWQSGDQSASLANLWGDFIDHGRVVHRASSSEYAVYDLAEQRISYVIKQESLFDAIPDLSPGRRYLALPEDQHVRVIESSVGDTVAVLPIAGGRSSAVAFNADGSKLAILTQNEIAIWTLGSSEPPVKIRADLLGRSHGSTLDWVEDEFLLINGELLFSIPMKLPVWSYRPQTGEVVRDDEEQRIVSIAAGRLCYGVSISGRNGFMVIGAVQLPGDLVRSTAAEVDVDRLYLIEPGASVSLEVLCDSYSPEVEAALREKIDGNGWTIRDDAQYRIVAQMGRGEQRHFSMQEMKTGATQNVSIEPYFSSLAILDDRRIIWSTGSTSGAIPSFVRVRDGETLQGKIDELAKPNPTLFSRARMPATIFDPRFRRGFGSSIYGKTGLEPGINSNLPKKRFLK